MVQLNLPRPLEKEFEGLKSSDDLVLNGFESKSAMEMQRDFPGVVPILLIFAQLRDSGGVLEQPPSYQKHLLEVMHV